MSDHSSPTRIYFPPLDGYIYLDEVKRPWRTCYGEKYEYCDLGSERHIRLLHMIVEEPRTLPRLEILSMPLDTAPAFEALSYCWGATKQPYHSPVETDRGENFIPLTDSLATAMVFLPRSCKTRYIWIDQICIDQQNDNEKGHQIELMGEIYSKAARVLVWLGPGPVADNDGRQSVACTADLRPVEIDNPKTNLEDLMGSNAVRSTYNNDWFQRAWVVQES